VWPAILDISSVPAPDKFSVTVNVVVNAELNAKEPAPTVRLSKVVVCPPAEGVNVKLPPALFTMILGKDIVPAEEKVAALEVSKVNDVDEAVIPPPDLVKLPFTVMLGMVLVALLLNVK
jgi:hypothetical protein